jgi:hypothetical protein
VQPCCGNPAYRLSSLATLNPWCSACPTRGHR